MEINDRLIISDIEKGKCIRCGKEHGHTKMTSFDDGIFKDCDDIRIFTVYYNCSACRRYYDKLNKINEKLDELHTEKSNLIFTDFCRKLNLLKNK
jgi:DNA-directed RNA polymerase subunit RPC12/RpoP